MKHVQTLTWVYSQGGDARLESMKQYAVRSETIEWWVKSPGLSTFNPTLAAERYTEEDKREALAKGVGRVNEASLDKGRPPRTWFDIPRENSRSKERALRQAPEHEAHAARRAADQRAHQPGRHGGRAVWRQRQRAARGGQAGARGHRV